MPLAIALLVAAGCAPGPERSTAARTSRTSASTPESRTSASAPRRAAISAEQRGFALPSWNTGDYDSPDAPAYIRAIAATGARWVQLTPTWYQRTAQDDAMHRTGETASDDSLRRIIQKAHAAGLKVLVKPHIDLPGDQDRATIRPAHRDLWFRAYGDFASHYAELAAQEKAEEFVVGTELAGVSRDRQGWGQVIRKVRGRFGGPLTYAANYDEYQQVPFWDLLDLVGIDAYWPLADKPTTDQAALARAWSPIAAQLKDFAKRLNRKVLFTEAGYVSQRGTTTEPYSWTVSIAAAGAEQAAAYQALLAGFSGKDWWAGVFWWMWDDWPGSGDTPQNLAYTPHGKPAEGVVRRWWGGG